MTISFKLLLSWRFWLSLLVLLAIVIFFVLRSTTAQVIIENLTPPDLPDQKMPETRETVAQNWTPEVSERFHFISQGTSTLPMPYDWLLALEQPEASPWGLLWSGAEGNFVADDYISRYGFVPSPASTENPDGLPIGFAKTPFENIAGYPTTTTAVGFTCAACHTGHLVYDDKMYLIDGGPAVTDLGVLTKGLGAALGQTVISSKLPLWMNNRFDRFAKSVLGNSYSKTAKAMLAKDLESVAAAGAKEGDVIDVVEGFGRLDALNRIGNQVFSKNVGLRENYTPIDAPVNYPHIWTASWFDWVQYDGSIMQPLVRNAGEALGVHANVNMTAPVDDGRFRSSIPMEDLVWIESTLAGPTPPYEDGKFGGLLSPKWPDTLPAIDAALAEQGAALYDKHCKGCHLPPVTSTEIFDHFKPIEWNTFNGPATTETDYLTLKIIDLEELGTDSAQADILAERRVNTAADDATGRAGMGINAVVCAPTPQYSGVDGASSGYDDSVSDRSKATENTLAEVRIQDGPMLSFALALGALVQQVNDSWLEANRVPPELRPAFEGNRPNCLQAGAGYKARPLNGIWATGPFLHNGSVPTLDDLLRPADQRPRFVRLGDPSFDPVKVGVAQPSLTADSYPPYMNGYFILDTALAGNRNTGHAFGASADGNKTGVIGPEFTDDQRKALIEYLKSL